MKKTLYKFIVTPLLISSVFFLALNVLPNPTGEEVLDAFINHDTHSPSESDVLWNNGGICMEDSLTVQNSNNDKLHQDDWDLIWKMNLKTIA